MRSYVRFAKRTIFNGIARLAPASTTGIRVLLYHAIGDPDPVDRMHLRVSRARFLEQMAVLRDEGFDVVPLDAVSNPPAPDGRVRVAITFDDGYRCQAWAAAVLRDFGFPATFFVVPRYLDGHYVAERYWENWRHLRWDEITSLADSGFEIGAHSTTHSALTACSGAHLDDEVSGARTRLEQRLGQTVRSFSYPFGRHDRRVRQAVERAGYTLACTSRYGINRAGQSSFQLCRTEIGGDDDLDVFRMKLRGQFDWLRYWQDVATWRDGGHPN